MRSRQGGGRQGRTASTISPLLPPPERNTRPWAGGLQGGNAFAYVLRLAGLGEDPLGHCYSQKNLSLACPPAPDCKSLMAPGLLHRHPLPPSQGMRSSGSPWLPAACVCVGETRAGGARRWETRPPPLAFPLRRHADRRAQIPPTRRGAQW